MANSYRIVFVLACLFGISSIAEAQKQPFPEQMLVQQEPKAPNLRQKVPNPLWTDASARPSSGRQTVRQNTFANIARDQRDAVVNIEVDLPKNPRFPGVHPVGKGSGFFIRSDGYIVTNAHVVEYARHINVTTADRKVYTAHVVGVDPETDIALIRIDMDKLGPNKPTFSVLKLANSDDVAPGQWVVAIGNPFGLNHTVTAGIVSAVHRRAVGAELKLRYTDFIQIDAAINPGNSGGPLLDMHGDVIGMNAALYSGSDLGFAIPSNMIRTVLGQMVEGSMERSWAGLALKDLSVSAAVELLDGRRGARVMRVAKDSPAEKAGLRSGDIVLRYNDKKVDDSEQLRWWIAMSPQKTKQTMSVQRDKRRVHLTLRLTGEPEAETGASKVDQAAAQPTEAPDGPHAFGVVVEPISNDGADASSATAGVRVIWVDPSSPAAFAGLRRGDILTAINGEPVHTVDDFLKAGKTVQDSEKISLRAIRANAHLFLFFQQR